MNAQSAERRLVWMLFGVMAGLCLAYFWPHEQAQAVSTDRSDQFAICTVEVGKANAEAVFVLDFATGRLTGGLINQGSGSFTNSWGRQVAADFQLDGGTKAKYAMIPGHLDFSNTGGKNIATGVLYIAELTSGKVIAYNFPYSVSKNVLPAQTLTPFAGYPFREAAKE